MVIENVMIHTDQVENFAVCCTDNLTIEAINRFLTVVQQQEIEEGTGPILTLVHNLEDRHWGPTKELRGDSGTLQSPFDGCDFLRIQQGLQQIKETTRSPIRKDWFLVLDKESEQSSTAVIVNVEGQSEHSVRVAYPVASRYLSAASVSSPPIDELIETANEGSGGVVQD